MSGTNNHKFLVIGLGSMGKRRVRNLIALGHKENIAGFDPRTDRTAEAAEYGIPVFNDFDEAIKEWKPTRFMISTPPNFHSKYMNIALENNIHSFIEASVVDSKEIINISSKTKGQSLVMAPSCTMRFYPGPIKVKALVEEKAIGDVLYFNYQIGQYLPDWHPWEKIQDFYVSNPDTGGAREIVPFELTWLNDVFGDSTPLTCVRRKLTDMPADIEDIYSCVLEYPGNILGNLTVEVISRPKATRECRIIGSKGEIIFSGETNSVKYINTDMDDWKEFSFDSGTVQSGYIYPEEPYINEVKAFIEAVENVQDGQPNNYPNTLEEDYKILQTLYKLEELSDGKKDLSR